MWSSDSPLDTVDAGTIAAEIIAAKTMIRLLGQATNADALNEHNWLTGKHVASQVGFVRYGSTAILSLRAGCLIHNSTYTLGGPSASTTGFCVGIGDDLMELAAVTEHTDITEGTYKDTADPPVVIDEHTQYYRRKGTRSMAADLTIAGTATLSFVSTVTDAAMDPAHALKTWHAAHFADGGLIQRHIADASFGAQSLSRWDGDYTGVYKVLGVLSNPFVPQNSLPTGYLYPVSILPISAGFPAYIVTFPQGSVGNVPYRQTLWKVWK